MRQGFTLLELLFSIALISTLLVSSLSSVRYFRIRAALSEARSILDTELVLANTNSLTGKSRTADIYLSSLTDSAGRVAKEFQPSHYFLLTKTGDGTEPSVIVYGELKVENQNRYSVLSVKRTTIPDPVFIQEILYTKQDATSAGSEQELCMIFEAPFGRVRFTSQPITVETKNSSGSYTSYAPLYEVEMSDIIRNLTLLLPEDVIQGTAEWGLQYRDRSDDSDNVYIQREYVKFDSSNKISHYWDGL